MLHRSMYAHRRHLLVFFAMSASLCVAESEGHDHGDGGAIRDGGAREDEVDAGLDLGGPLHHHLHSLTYTTYLNANS